VFIVGHLGGFSGRKVFPITNTYQQNSKSVQRYISNTLTARYEAAQATGTYIGEGQFDAQKIRRLTPKECERLQGFPDDWTKYGVGDEPISDTQRYKMCGNAVTTNVITAVIGGLYG
jgi:site-specific DNA-cytosine methylase